MYRIYIYHEVFTPKMWFWPKYRQKIDEKLITKKLKSEIFRFSDFWFFSSSILNHIFLHYTLNKSSSRHPHLAAFINPHQMQFLLDTSEKSDRVAVNG